MNKPIAIPAITTAEIQDEMWLEIARYNAVTRPDSRAMQLLPAAAGEQGPLPLPGLLALDGPAFVEAAYRTILNRPADEAGVGYFSQEIAAGTSKVVLLGQLQRSAEGRQLGRPLPGLRRRYMAHRLYRIPVLGGVARLAASVLRRSGVSGVLGGAARPGSRRQQAAALARLGAAHEAAERRAKAQDAALDGALRRIAALQAQQDQTLGAGIKLEDVLRRLAEQEAANQRLVATLATQGRTLTSLTAANLEFGRRLGGVEDSSLEAMLAMNNTLEQHGGQLERLEGLLSGERVVAGIDAQAQALRRTLDERLGRAEAIVVQNRQDVVDQERRIGLILEALRTRVESMPEIVRVQDEQAVDSLYVDFEDRFRGSRADIKERLRFYLPVLEEAQAGSPGRPVVDVGCGRGEFLELLREEGFAARGVDVNAAMAATCTARGLDCAADDALAYLGRQPGGSLGAVTGFHIIEHLPFKTMVRLFDAAFMALAPGGLVVFETPNPANLLVASRWFYLDPTHRNPLPGEMVAMIAEARGFARVSIVELHPMEQRFGGGDTVLREQLDSLFHGPQDYALLARKP